MKTSLLRKVPPPEHYRKRLAVTPLSSTRVMVEGKACLNFCSNDYLGLAHHPKVISAWQRGADIYGIGSGASPLVSGYTPAHAILEEKLAELTRRDRALFLPSGYQNNLTILHALVQRGDHVWADRLCHGSLLDGLLLSRAIWKRYPHRDMAILQTWLAQNHGASQWVVSDGVFSMDGTLAPLPDLIRLCQRYQATLVLDDAHGLGVLGAHGGGTLEYYGIDSKSVPILIGTLGKSFGVSGAFVAGEYNWIEYLLQSARGYRYSTAAPPALAMAATEAIEIAQKESWRREKLHALIHYFRSGAESLKIPISEAITPIQPLIVGSSQGAMALSHHLLNQGFFVIAIRPPTVPNGQSRLRITLSADHKESDIDALLTALVSAWKAIYETPSA